MTTTIPTSGACLPTRTRSRTGSADGFVLTLWTADPDRARLADMAGVERIGVDLERLGKESRQRGLGTWISPHTEDDLETLAGVVRHAGLFARLDPLNPDTERQVDSLIERGASVLMLPMVGDAAEAAVFADYVAGRATTVLLVETREAVARIDSIAAVEGIHEIHIGLNDLALSLGLRNRWLVLAGDLVSGAGRQVRARGLRFGFGGIGRVGDDALPVGADLVYSEYARTGATAALLSRSFFDGLEPEAVANELGLARERLAGWSGRDRRDLDAAHEELGRQARAAAGW